MADAAGGAAVSNAGNTSNTGNRPPRLNDNLAKAFAATVTILSTVGTISGIVAGFGKSGLDGLWVTLIISLAFALLIVIIVAIYFYRNNVISRRLPVLAAIGLLILLVGGGAGYAAGARADSAAPPPTVPTPRHSITATSAAPTSPPSTEPPTSTPSRGPSITPPPTAPASASPPTAPSTANRPAVIPVGPYRSFTDPKTTEVSAVAVSPDGNTLATADVNGGAFLFNIPTNSFIAGLYDPNGQPAWDVVFSPDGSLVAVADTNGSAYLWNLASGNGQVVKTFRDPAGLQVMGVAFTPDGGALVTTSQSGKGNYDNAIRVWNVATGTLIHTFSDASKYGPGRLALSRDGQLLAVADADAEAYVWQLNWLHA